MSEQNDHFAQLLAIVNEEEDEGEELTEEELQQALDSPTLHQNAMECDEESTECDEFENSDGFKFDNNNNSNDNKNKETDKKSCLSQESSGSQKRTEYQFQMMDHHIFKGKHGKKLYKCDVCYAVYRHSFSLKRHFIRSHINYGYLCETDVTNCGINLASSASLQTWNTQQSHNNLSTSHVDLPELYCCHSCVLFYDELSQIKSHVDDCHRNTKSGSIEPIRIPCSQCNMSFIQRHNLMRHIEVVHHGRKLYGCKHCGKKFQTIADRKKHEKNQHQVKQSEQSTHSSKTHSCVRCSQIFFTYSDLRKHVSKKHKECYNPCAFCNKFLFNKKQLSQHLRQRHEKTPKDNVEKMKLKKRLPLRVESRVDQSSARTTTSITSNSIASQNTHQAYFHCSLCYRRFLTYGSLIRHKQIAHRPQVRHCSRLTAERQIDDEIIEPFNNANEIEFYRTLAQRVAENLLYFVDGKFVNCHNSSDKEVIPYAKRNVGINDKTTDSEINLVKYNFPENFKCSSPPSINTEKLEFLLDCDLNTVPNTKIDIISPSEETTETTTTPSKPLFICTACHEKISPELFADHEANNHPNVYCTYVEVDPLRNIPSQLLLWQYHCADGLLHRCSVAPSLTKAQSDSNISLKCTKCTKSFASVSLLHNHILECAHNNSSKKKSINISKNHNNNSIITTTATTSPSNTNTSNINNNNNNNNLLSSSNVKESDFSSPLSPCKTRSGKRRQISPEEVKTKKSKTTPKSSETESKQTPKEIVINESKAQITDNNCNDDQRVQKESTNEEKSNQQLIVSEISNEENSTKNVPKRYTCEKCTKKFVYMDSLTKHQLSCKRVFNTKRAAKQKSKKIQQNKKLALKIEIKAIKNIQKYEEKKKKVCKQTKPLKSTASDEKSVTNTDLKKETQESEQETQSNTDNNDSSSMTWTPSTSNIQANTDSSIKDIQQTNEKNLSTTIDTPNTSLQEHRCPDCLRVFTYTANFRKHIKNVCPVRKQLGSDGTPTSSSPITSTPIQKTIRESSVNEVTNIVIKQEKPEIDEQINTNPNENADEEVVFEGETPVEENNEDDDDVVDISMSSKDDSKLDLWRVKQENPMFAFKGSPAQHHSCPYCQRGFTYLANYRKHIKSICPIRQQIEEKKKQVIEDNNEQEVNGVKVKCELSIPTLVYTPSSLSVRSQIEDTVLTLLRDQTKQDQILQSSEELVKSKSNDESVECSSTDISANIANNSTNSSNETEISDEFKSAENDKTKDKKKETSSPSGKGSSYRFRTFSCSICHKIFLSYVTMLKHRLSHKLSDGSANDDNNNTNANESITTTSNDNNNQLIQVNHDKEIQNQALAASLLKRSKEAIFCKMRGNTLSGNNSNNININKPVINTTELLEKLARGGISSESLQLNKSKENGQELVVETKANANTLNLQLNASTSNSSANNSSNNNNSNNNNNNLQEILIDANNLNDLDLGVLKDGVIVQDLQQLIVGENNKLPVNEVLLDIDPNDIGSANELWITFTDSSAFVQVPENNNSNNNNNNANKE